MQLRPTLKKENINKIYVQINPELVQSPFVNCLHPTARDIVRFRLGSHKVPIETGRWNRVNRELRFCQLCGILGDEHHYIYICPMIRRSDLNLSDNMNQMWSQEGVVELIRRLKDMKGIRMGEGDRGRIFA